MRQTSHFFYLFFSIGLFLGCSSKERTKTYESETLKILPISENTYRHVSYLKTETTGVVACNGVVYIHDNEAVLFDSPTNPQATEELIDWIRNTKKAQLKGVFFTHFHIDCIGGQAVLQNEEIPIYAHEKTFDRMDKPEGLYVFRDPVRLMVGGKEVVGRHLGEAHTEDNIVCHVPSEDLLFGGCMVKSIGAKKGNLADANVSEWSRTVARVKAEYPKLKTVVPGHGKPGGTELLDYTITLFKTP